MGPTDARTIGVFQHVREITVPMRVSRAPRIASANRTLA